jgi:ATP adenylyltransferase
MLRSDLRHGYTPAVTSLSSRISSTAKRAIETGALVPVPTETAMVPDGEIPFIVHVTKLQQEKTEAKRHQHKRPFNPFLPPDPDLLIDDLPPNHVSVLNKFNVLEDHLLIVTRDFEPQEDLLNTRDLAALCRCMSEIDGLGFYNGGVIAGASQPHKHLQLVPLPLRPGELPTPLDAVIDDSSPLGVVNRVGVFDFAHALIPLDGSPITVDRAAELAHLYRTACESVGVHDVSRPYNLLLTRRWLLVVPRSREFWAGVSINALGFAGSLLVRSACELDELRAVGPLRILRSVVEEAP